eukprot:4962215-Prymnesium_polylepis.1
METGQAIQTHQQHEREERVSAGAAQLAHVHAPECLQSAHASSMAQPICYTGGPAQGIHSQSRRVVSARLEIPIACSLGQPRA